MNTLKLLKLIGAASLVTLLSACAEEGTATDLAEAEPVAATPVAEDPIAAVEAEKARDATAPWRSPGKPMPPVTVNYKLQGKAVVGQPVAVELEVHSKFARQRVNLTYRSNDKSALQFGAAQVEKVSMETSTFDAPAKQQVVVVPQREGRVFLNVEAELVAEGGSMTTVTAIPIQVGDAPQLAGADGAVETDAEGNLVKSMPARED